MPTSKSGVKRIDSAVDEGAYEVVRGVCEELSRIPAPLIGNQKILDSLVRTSSTVDPDHASYYAVRALHFIVDISGKGGEERQANIQYGLGDFRQVSLGSLSLTINDVRHGLRRAREALHAKALAEKQLYEDAIRILTANVDTTGVATLFGHVSLAAALAAGQGRSLDDARYIVIDLTRPFAQYLRGGAVTQPGHSWFEPLDAIYKLDDPARAEGVPIIFNMAKTLAEQKIEDFDRVLADTRLPEPGEPSRVSLRRSGGRIAHVIRGALGRPQPQPQSPHL